MATQGLLLNDRYEVEKPLGRGGMAEVFRGTDRVLGRTVAIKVLDRRYRNDAKFVTRFRREAQAAAGINHPNVVSIYDTGSQDGVHFIVMEYVDGETLDSLLAREKRLPPARAVAIAEPVAQALEVAHQKGMVHRDVKPGNIMIDRSGVVKVMDFGIARAAADDTLTQTGVVLGTAAYISPEQAQGEPVDPRSDVYSLGCVLYEMLTGRKPFIGDSPLAIAYKHVREEPTPPSEVEPDVPPEIEAVVMGALAKDPDQRFLSGGAMREALAAAATGEMPEVAAAEATQPLPHGGDTAVMTAPPEEAPEPTRRSWLPWIVIAAILAALVVLAFVALAGDDRPAERRGGAEQTQPATDETAPADPVEDAYSNFLAVLGEGVASAEVSQKAADEIGKDAGEAVAAYQEGDTEKAATEIAEASAKVLEALEKGEITSEERAAQIQTALEELAAAMEVTFSPPAESDEGSDESDEGSDESDDAPGHSEDRGKGNDKGKDKGKDKD